MAEAPQLPEIAVASRGDLRDWLRSHHAESGSVWLVTWKLPDPRHVPFGEFVEELLCWGWVDSRTRGIDAARSSVLVSPRNPASAWSAVNKQKVVKARTTGAMTPSGEAVITAAVENGAWAFLDDVERLEVPGDLARALAPDGMAGWEAWPRHVKRGTMEWVKTAKRAPTRDKRIAEVATAIAEGRRPAPFARATGPVTPSI